MIDASIPLVTVAIGQFLDQSGHPDWSGTVTFTPSAARLHSPTGTVLTRLPIAVPITEGQGAVDLVASDAPGMTRTGVQYTVSWDLRDAHGSPVTPDFPRVVFLPAGSGTVDLELTVPVDPTDPGSVAIPVGVRSVADLTGAIRGADLLTALGITTVPRPAWVDVRDHGGTGDGSVQTSALHAARDAAGPNGTVRLPAGVYGIDALTLSKPGQRWMLDGPNAVLKAKAGAPPAAHVTVTADGVQISGGTIDGNRAAQTGGGDGGGGHGLLVVGVSDFRADGLAVADCVDNGVRVGAVRNFRMAGGSVRNCAPRLNQKQIQVWDDGDSDGIRFDGVTIDGLTSGNGGIACTLSRPVRVRGLRVNGCDIVVGSTTEATLGVELFTSLTGGGIIEDWSINDNRVYGTGPLCFGISATGVCQVAGKGTRKGGIHKNRIFDCPETSIEIIASDVSFTGNVADGCGPLYINGTQVAGGISDIAGSGNVFTNSVGYALAMLGGTAGIRRVNLAGNTFAGPHVRFNGLLNGILSDNVFALSGGSLDFESAATQSPGANPQDFTIRGGTITPGDTSHDGVILAYTRSGPSVPTGRLNLENLAIRGPARHGVYVLNPMDNVSMRGLDIRGVAQHGVYAAASGCSNFNLWDSAIEGNGGWGVIWGTTTNVGSGGNRVRGNTSGQVSSPSATFVTLV